jgi:hypothetical protein
MPATDIKQLFNFENNFERAVESILTAGGIDSASTFIQGANETLPESRIEITFAAGEATNQAALQTTGEMVYDFFSARLTLRIVTVRPDAQPSIIPGVMSLHEAWCATVRSLLQERVVPFTLTNLPYYGVQTIRPIATQRDLDPRWLEDFTRLDFLVEFGIRSDAWPA